MTVKTIGGIIAASALALPTIVSAQNVQANNIISLSDWNNQAAYSNGISIKDMLDEAEVYGPTGDDIGSVENVIFGRNGQVLSIIAQVGGFWDIGDTHVNVPWNQVNFTADGRLTVPVTEDSVDNYSLYADNFADDVISDVDATSGIERVDDDLATGPRTWKATDLIGDYARLRGNDNGARNYGYVNDVIVRDGEIAAVVVQPDVGWTGNRGYYAYPYYGYGYGWTPGSAYYDLPYSPNEANNMRPFDYNRY